MRLMLGHRPSPIGELRLIWDAEKRVRALDFGDYEPRMHRLLGAHYKDGYELVNATPPAALTDPIDAYFAGKLEAVDEIEVASGGSAFQREVWAALRDISAGTTMTYGALARVLGHPAASRAVGAANGANPIALIVPCHRVIGANGTLTGYGGGLHRKRWLLAHEGVQLAAPGLFSPEIDAPGNEEATDRPLAERA
jgi:methylated-DNA-[protein]-cysteine S-methyltransferase